MSEKLGLTRMKKSSSALKLDTVREVKLAKKQDEPFGCELLNVGKKVFVTLVRSVEVLGDGTYTPAYRIGLKFGDEILRVNGVDAHSMDVRDLYASITQATEIEVDFICRSMQIDYSMRLEPGQQIGLQIVDSRVVAVKPDSAADVAGVQPDSVIISINGKSLVGLTDNQIASNIVKEARPLGGSHKTFTLTVMPYTLYVRLLPAFLQAIDDFGLSCSPSFFLDADGELTPRSLQAPLLAPKLAPNAFTCRAPRKKRGASVSAYFLVGGDD